MQIKYNGFYISKGKKFKDKVSVNVERETVLYKYLKLNEDGTFIKAIFDNPNYDFLTFILNKSEKELLEDTSIPYGTYQFTDNNTLVFKYRVMNKWDRDFELKILNPSLLQDCKGELYYYKDI